MMRYVGLLAIPPDLGHFLFISGSIGNQLGHVLRLQACIVPPCSLGVDVIHQLLVRRQVAACADRHLQLRGYRINRVHNSNRQ